MQALTRGRLVAIALGLATACGLANAVEALAPAILLRIAGTPLTAELALTESQQERGLMGRTGLPADGGMLFPLPVDHEACVWMKDTSLPLSVAFIDATGFIVDVRELEPNDVTPRCATHKVRFILEAPAGWFTGHQAAEGAHVMGLPGADVAR